MPRVNTFFDSIDCPQKAWVLGWLFADGTHNPKRGTIKVSLQATDIVVLKRIRNFIDSTIPIYTYGTMSEFQVTNKTHMSKSLLSLGMLGNKTHLLCYPDIPEELNSHFIRGVFEGDGGVSLYRGGSQSLLQITGHMPFLREISNIVELETGIRFGEAKDKRLKTDTGSIVLSSKKHIKTVGLYMYEGSSGMSLPRKRKVIYSIVHHKRKPSSWIGRTHREDSKEKMKEAKMGKKLSIQTRLKMSEAQKTRWALVRAVGQGE